MYKRILAANWKMNLGINDSLVLAKKIAKDIKVSKDKQYILCPSFHSIYSIKNKISKIKLYLGAQDCSQFSNGAYTGDISATMLTKLGCKYVILGHSERRIYLNENNEILKKKLYLAHKASLKVIFCVGEKIEDYKINKSKEKIEKQLSDVFSKNISKENLIIAYEPVWAIGTNKTPNLDEINGMHKFIKELIKKRYRINNIRVLYGGSVNSSNSRKIFSLSNVDGGLIGGASLNASEFIKIYDSLN